MVGSGKLNAINVRHHDLIKHDLPFETVITSTINHHYQPRSKSANHYLAILCHLFSASLSEMITIISHQLTIIELKEPSFNQHIRQHINQHINQPIN